MGDACAIDFGIKRLEAYEGWLEVELRSDGLLEAMKVRIEAWVEEFEALEGTFEAWESRWGRADENMGKRTSKVLPR